MLAASVEAASRHRRFDVDLGLPLMMPPASVTSGLTQPVACSASVARVLSCWASRIAVPTAVRIEVRGRDIVEIGADLGIGAFIGLDREVARLEVGGPEMLGVGQRGPGQEILGAFRHVRNHFEQHDGFVEMIQIVGGEPGARIDIGGAQLRRAGLVEAARRWRHRAIGSRRWGPSRSSVPVLASGVNRP